MLILNRLTTKLKTSSWKLHNLLPDASAPEFNLTRMMGVISSAVAFERFSIIDFVSFLMRGRNGDHLPKVINW